MAVTATDVGRALVSKDCWRSMARTARRSRAFFFWLGSATTYLVITFSLYFHLGWF